MLCIKFSRTVEYVLLLPNKNMRVFVYVPQMWKLLDFVNGILNFSHNIILFVFLSRQSKVLEWVTQIAMVFSLRAVNQQQKSQECSLLKYINSNKNMSFYIYRVHQRKPADFNQRLLTYRMHRTTCTYNSSERVRKISKAHYLTVL